MNGEESAASKWLDKVNFDIQSQLEFKSAGADLNVKERACRPGTQRQRGQ